MKNNLIKLIVIIMWGGFFLNGCAKEKPFNEKKYLTKVQHKRFEKELALAMNEFSYQIKYEIVHEIIKQIERIKQSDQTTSESQALSSIIADIFSVAADEIERKLANDK